jgi:4-hydroxybenzoate polyprenyltransferase
MTTREEPERQEKLPGAVQKLGRLVAFSHSVFALPFALIMVLAVSKEHTVSFSQLVALVVCVVAARTAAMAFNRIVDEQIDSQNPRTQSRELPSGEVSHRQAVALCGLSALVFVGSAWWLGIHCLVLTPVVLAVLLGYSFLKRFTVLCHFVLGVALALAPGGVWYALTAEWSWLPVPLIVAVLLWVAGFDILYSCQDIEFDRAQGLYSVPSRWGYTVARGAASLLHALATVALIVFGANFKLGFVYSAGVVVFSLLLVSQHIAIARRGVGCIDRVFFTRNGTASVLLFLFVLAERVL